MSMPLDLYVIRHGESEANVIVQAGEQGDNSLYTQDNVTVPDRSWRLTATGRKQADCIGRWLVSQQQLFDRYMVSPYVRTRETAATMALPKAKWEENRVLRERSWGEINTITKDEFKNNYARNWNFKNTDPLYWRPPAGESIADVAEDRVHNILTSLSRKSDSESVVMVTHGDFMLALMLTIEDLADEEFLHRADSDDWKITNCTCLHYTRRDPETGRTSKRVRWEQTARPVLDETTGRWAGQGGAVARIQAPVSLQWRFGGCGAGRRSTPAGVLRQIAFPGRETSQNLRELEWCVVRLVVNAVPQARARRVVMSNIFQWQLHGDGKTLAPGEVVEPDERLTWVRTAGIGAQHVIAMFGATFLVPILTGFDPSTTLFFTAMSTALFLLINRNVLPSYLGSSFGFIAPITAVTTANKGIAVASFGIMVTGILLALVGVLVHYAGSKWIDIIMPPVVNGAIVAIIGFNLAPSVWTNFQAAPDTALVTLLAVLLVAVLFKGLLGRLNILVGVIIGYVYACIRGQVDFSAIGDAAWIGFPKFHLPQADFSILPMFIPVVLVLVAENVGHVKSVAQMTGRDYDNQIGTALMADGLGTTLAGFGGGSGTTTYGENIGVMAATKVYSTAAYWCAAAFALILSLCPKFGAVINTIPAGVLGGVTTLLYGMIGMIGIRIWVENKVNFDKPLNIMVAAITMIIAIGQFAFTVGGISFNGIAIGTIVILVAYHGLKAIGKATGTIAKDDPDIL